MSRIGSKRRRLFMYLSLDKFGDLICVTCGQRDLIINHHQDNDIPPWRRASIDHIVEFSKGGKNDFSNFQIMCEKCNNEKSNHYMVDINKIKYGF